MKEEEVRVPWCPSSTLLFPYFYAGRPRSQSFGEPRQPSAGHARSVSTSEGAQVGAAGQAVPGAAGLRVHGKRQVAGASPAQPALPCQASSCSICLAVVRCIPAWSSCSWTLGFVEYSLLPSPRYPVHSQSWLRGVDRHCDVAVGILIVGYSPHMHE